MEFRHLIADPTTRKAWDPAMSVEVDRFIETKTIRFIKRAMIPRGEKVVYTRLVADLRPDKTVHERLRMCMGRDQMNSVIGTTTRTADQTTCKVDLNGVVSTEDRRFTSSDVNDFSKKRQSKNQDMEK